MTQQTADDLDVAINAVVENMVADAQRLDADEWLYASRLLAITYAVDGLADAKVSGWLGRHDHQFRGVDIDDESGNMSLAQALLATDTTPRLAIVRVSRMPQTNAEDLEVSVDFVEFAFDEPVDVANRDLGGFSLFGDI